MNWDSLFFPLPRACVPEPLGKWIVIDLQLGDLLVLVGCDSDELCFLEDVSAERGVGQLEDIIGAY